MKTVTFYKKDIYRGNLILVNHDYPLKNDHIHLNEFQNVPAERTVVALLNEIFSSLHISNKLTLVSGFRSLDEQMHIYQHSLVENGKKFTQQYVALPNHSEHQSGLAIDLALTSPNIDFIRPDFPYQGTSQIFRENAHRYGFIERYQSNKETITHIAAEPWHFRYIGIPHSYLMKEKDWCLEEYIQEIKAYSLQHPLHYCIENKLFTIFYIAIPDEHITLQLKEDACYQISGNNVDGIIVTAWRPYV